MANQIKVDTSVIENCVEKLMNLKVRAQLLDMNMQGYTTTRLYNNTLATLSRDGSPSDFLWRIDQNISYLKEVVNRVNGAENFLNKLDPLNYSESFAKVEEERKFQFTEFAVDVVSNFGIMGPVVKCIKGACAVFQEPNLDSISKIIGGQLGMISKACSVASKMLDKENEYNLGQLLLGLVNGTPLGEAVEKVGAKWSDVVKGGLKTLGEEIGIKAKKVGETATKKLNKVEKVSNRLKKFSTIAKWAGKIVKIGTTFYDNYKESGFSAETFKSTLADCGADFIVNLAFDTIAIGLCTAVAAAATAVAGAVAAPAVIAVATGVAVFASSDIGQAVVSTSIHSVADFACKKKTGKKVDEIVSDTLNDSIDNSINTINQIDKKINDINNTIVNNSVI